MIAPLEWRAPSNDSPCAHPHRGVVEGRAAVRRDRIGADQDIDADAIKISVARPVALDDDDAGSRGERGPGAQPNLAAPIAEPHQRALAETQPGGVFLMDQRARLALAGDRTRRFGEGGIEEAARRGHDEAERQLPAFALVVLEVVG